MEDQDTSKAQLASELSVLRQRVAELEKARAVAETGDLFAQTQRSYAELVAIHRSSQRLLQWRSLESLAPAIVQILEDALSYEFGAVLLIEESTNRLVPFALSEQGHGPSFVEQDKSYVLSHEPRLGKGITGWVAEHGTSVRLGNVRSDPRYFAMRDGIRSELCVPLRFQDKILGVVNVESTQPDAYTEADQRVLETAAAQMAVAIHNARLYEQVQHHAMELEGWVEQRTAELESANARLQEEVADRLNTEAELQRRLSAATLLHKVSSRIASAADMTGALQDVCAELAEFLGVPQAGFAMLDASRSSAEIVADYHPPDTSSALSDMIPAIDNPSMAQILRDPLPLVVSDAQWDPRLAPVQDIMRRRNVQSILIVPLIVEGQVIGTLGFDSYERREFDDSDIELVQQVANQAGQALMRRRAEDALARHADEMASLYRTSLDINAQTDLPTLLNIIVKRAAQLLQVRMGGLYLTRPGCRDLELVVGYNLPGDYAGTVLQLGEGLSGRVAQSGQPIMVSDYLNWENVAPAFRGEPFRRVLGVPLRVGERIVGVLTLTDDQDTEPFDTDQVRMASLFADQAAVAVENARLLEAERSTREQTEVLREAAHVIGATLDVDQILRSILDQLRRVLVYDTASVLVLRGEDRPDLVVGRGYPEEMMTSREAARLLHESPILQSMVETHKAVVSGDVRHLDGWIRVPGADHVRSWMAIPLVTHGRMVGVLMVDHAQENFYSEADLEVAQALAQHAAQALENARLFEETERLKAFNESIVQGVAEGILIEDSEGRIAFANAAMESILGTSSHELIGQHWTAIVPSDCVAQVSHQVARRPHGRSGRYETRLLTKSGSRVPVMVSSRPLFDGDLFTGVLSAFTDISERVEAERDVEERRRYLEAVLTAAPDAIVTLDAQHRIVEWNPGAEALFGYTREETIGQDIDCLITTSATVEEATKITERVMSGQHVPPMETVRHRKDGTPVDVMLAGAPILVGGQLSGTVAVYADISERKRAEQALTESESRLSGILSSMVDLVYAFDELGRFTFYHAPGNGDSHVSPDQFLGRLHSQVMPPHVDRAFTRAFDENRAGRVARYEYGLELGGQTRWFSVNLSPLFLGGEFRGSVAVARDVTDRKHAEAALYNANRGLRMLSECTAALSRAMSEQDLVQETCRIAVDIGGYRLAWVGYADQDEARTVQPIAQSGFEEGYLETVRITWADTERGRGPTGTAIRTHAPVIAGDLLSDPGFGPWREEATRRGYASSIALPLLAEGRCLGALNIYASEPDSFSAEEAGLLAEVADNVAYGIVSLRNRAERRWMEGVVQRYAERLETLHQVDRAILEAQSPEDIARATLDRIRRLVPCRQARISAFDPDGQVPRVLAADDVEPASVAGEHAPTQEAIETGRDAPREDVSIPLIARGELIGVLRLAPATGQTLTLEHIEIAYEVATPLAVALEHARLNERLRFYADGLEETVSQRTRELQAERDRTQAILESLGEAVIVADVEGRILFANRATLALTGFAGAEVLGESWRALQGVEQALAVYRRARESIRSGKPWRGELVSLRKDSTSYDVAVTVAPLFDPDDPTRLMGSVWVQRDVTALKEAERLKDRFISNVSHELRTPLSIIALIVGNLDRLYDELDDARRRDMIRSIREHVGMLGELVGDVLEISRIDSRRVSAERSRVDLVRLAREEMEQQRPLARRKDQHLAISGSAKLMVEANEGQLRQIIRNLLNNAIKFTAAGGEIGCDCRQGVAGEDWGPGWPGTGALSPGQWAGLRVKDTGLGIARDSLPYLFDRFFRVESQGDIPGTGLGLAITRELVELHGGHIAVDSTVGQGSIFAVYLPLGAPQDPRQVEESKSNP